MLKPNPQKEVLQRKLGQATAEAYADEHLHGEEIDTPQMRALEAAIVALPILAYSDKDGAHQKAAELLIKHADATEGVTPVDLTNPRAFAQAAEQNPAHALPLAYLLAKKVIEEREYAATTVGDTGTKALSTPTKAAPSTEQILETVLLRARIRGHNDPIAEYKAQQHQPLLADAVAEQERALRDKAERQGHVNAFPIFDKHGKPDIDVTVEALGRLCVQELKVRRISETAAITTKPKVNVWEPAAAAAGEPAKPQLVKLQMRKVGQRAKQIADAAEPYGIHTLDITPVIEHQGGYQPRDGTQVQAFATPHEQLHIGKGGGIREVESAIERLTGLQVELRGKGTFIDDDIKAASLTQANGLQRVK